MNTEKLEKAIRRVESLAERYGDALATAGSAQPGLGEPSASERRHYAFKAKKTAVDAALAEGRLLCTQLENYERELNSIKGQRDGLKMAIEHGAAMRIARKPFLYAILTELGHVRSARRTRKAAERYIEQRVSMGIAGSARWWIKPVYE